MTVLNIAKNIADYTGRKIKATSMEVGKAYVMTNHNIFEKSVVSSELVFFVGCGKFIDGENHISKETIKISMMGEDDRYYFSHYVNDELVTFSVYKKYNSLTISDGYHRLSFNEVTVDIPSISVDNVEVEENVEVVKKEVKEEEDKFDSDIEFWKKHNKDAPKHNFKMPIVKIVTNTDEQLEKFCDEYPNYYYAKNNEIFIPFTLDFRSNDIKKICNDVGLDYWTSYVIPNKD